VDRRTKRYREPELPGLEINEIGGKTFSKAMLEWNCPAPFRRRLARLPRTWLRTALFATGSRRISTTARSAERSKCRNQMDVRKLRAPALENALFGWASAFEKGVGEGRGHGVVKV
jgi:hypothetical protein